MWTCDIIKALQAIEVKMGYPTCIKNIVQSMTGIIIIETTGGVRYHYNITSENFID